MRHTLFALTLLASSASAQFTLHDAHTTADLRGIDNVGGGVAWASGTDGTILRTEDAGFIWQLCAKPPNGEHLDFRAIQAFDNNTAIIMSSGKGDQSRLYKTTDGCQHWTLLFTNPDKDGLWDALQFERKFEPPTNRVAHPSTQSKGGVSRVKTRESDHKLGMLLGDPVKNSFALFVTNDGGAHWTKQRNRGLEASPSLQGAFAASNTSMYMRNGFVAFASGGTAGAALYRLTETTICLDDCSASEMNADGRENKWIRVEVPIGDHTESSGIFSMNARDKMEHSSFGDSIFIAVGGDYTRPSDKTHTAAYSLDGGKTWIAATTPPHGYRSAVAYDSKTKTWITIGPNGTDISTDDGRNWHPLKPDPAFNDTPDADQHWNALSLPYAVGPHGRIATLRPSALTSSK